MATNRQIALQEATKRYEGLRPAGQRAYFPAELGAGILDLATIYEAWLEGASAEDALKAGA